MESQFHVAFLNYFLLVHSRSQELSVIKLAVLVEVDFVEEFVHLLITHVAVSKSLFKLFNFKGSRVILIEFTECVSEHFKIEVSLGVSCLDILVFFLELSICKEHKSFLLKFKRGSKILNSV